MLLPCQGDMSTNNKPRALPWASCFCPFGAFACKSYVNLDDNLDVDLNLDVNLNFNLNLDVLTLTFNQFDILVVLDCFFYRFESEGGPVDRSYSEDFRIIKIQRVPLRTDAYVGKITVPTGQIVEDALVDEELFIGQSGWDCSNDDIVRGSTIIRQKYNCG